MKKTSINHAPQSSRGSLTFPNFDPTTLDGKPSSTNTLSQDILEVQALSPKSLTPSKEKG